MIHGGTPYHVLKISELTRLVASQFALIGAEGSAVNLACVCRTFEEPALSLPQPALGNTMGVVYPPTSLARSNLGIYVYGMWP